jgi:hypothetical protein
MHNCTPDYASTASILKPFEKKVFEEVIFSSKSSKPLGPQEMELKKKRSKSLFK